MAQVPGQRLGELSGQGGDRGGERVRDGFGLVVATRERDEHQEPGLALHQGGMRYDRARKNLDRHPNYILAAYMASGT